MTETNYNIPNKKGVEIAVKKIYRTLFPFNTNLTNTEIDTEESSVRY